MRQLPVAAFALILLYGCGAPAPAAPPPKTSTSGPKASGFQQVPKTSLADHIPVGADFDKLLTRDLEKAFNQTQDPDVEVSYELLDKTPVRSGQSFPKFYLWVRVQPKQGEAKEGLVTVAAQNKKKFQVGPMETLNDLKSDPKIEAALPQKVANAMAAKRG